VKALLKPYDVELRKSGLVTRATPSLPALGEAKEILSDAFAAKSPIDPKQGGKAKKYNVGAATVVALVTDSQAPDLSKFEEEKPALREQLRRRKEGELFQAWLKTLRDKAKIDANTAVVGGGGEEG
jgi:hypothetical protein